MKTGGPEPEGPGPGRSGTYDLAGAVAAGLALPFRKSFTQVVFVVIARCTQNEPIATAERKIGMPTEGFTTHHIFP